MTSLVSEALAKLRAQFAGQLPGRLDAIGEHFQRLDLADWRIAEAEAVHRLTHSLTGSAGTFGMQSVSDAARALETQLAAILKTGATPTPNDWQSLCAAFERLKHAARVPMETGGPSPKPPVAPQRDSRSPLVFLVEDDPIQAGYLGQIIRDSGYQVRAFTDPAGFRSAFNAAGAERPAVVVMDLVLLEGDDAGAALITECGLGKDSGIPVVVVSVRDDLPGRLATLRAGANRYFVKPVDNGRLIDALDGLTKRPPAQPYRVLLVDDDPLLLETAHAILRWAGMEVRTLSQPLEFLTAVDDFAPDVVVLDVYMPDATGLELASVLRERESHERLPILFMSAETDITQQLRALNLGGDDFLVKPVQPGHLVAAVTDRARRARQNRGIQQRLETIRHEGEREHLAVDHPAIVSVTK